MKEIEDQRIADKIRQVFDNFEDPSSEQGWQELRKKYPERYRRPLFIWMSSAAALLLILSGLWFNNSFKQKDDQIVADKTHKSIGDKDTPATIENKDAAPASETAKIENRKSGKSFSNPAYTVKGFEIALTKERNIVPATSQNVIQTSVPVISFPDIANHTLADRSDIRVNQSHTRDYLIDAMAKMSLLNPINRLKENKLPQVENIPATSQKNNDKNLSFSLSAGSYFNYAEGSESNLNFGAGFSSDIRMSKNFKFSTGLNLAKNSLRYNQNLPANADKSFQNSPASGSSNLTTLTTITNYNAELLSLDIPLNIKYLISPEKNTFYILAGLSSGTYLTETYKLQYRSFSPSSGMYINQAQGQEIKKQLKDFDLARTLNISFGFSTRLSKTQSVTIEPFLKYPLGGLGTENLKFGSSGINLKLNFKSTKNND